MNVGAAQELKDMPDAIRIRLPGNKDATPTADAP
jgi:hypothetical protein